MVCENLCGAGGDASFVPQTYLVTYGCDAGVDLEKDAVTIPVPYGGMLLFSNVMPHRRYVIQQTDGQS